MPPPANFSAPARDKDKRIDSFLAFAYDLQNKLPDLTVQSDINRLTSGLDSQIRAIKSCTLRSPGLHRNAPLDSAGTSLWNLCTQLIRRNHDDQSSRLRKVLIMSRVFAFLVLALAQWGDHNTPSHLIRLEKLAIKTGRSCIEWGELEFALVALQRAADYNGLLQNMHGKLQQDQSIVFNRLEAEYCILRIALSWKEDRLDVAEHMHSKSESLKEKLDPTSAEKFADTLFEIGKDLVLKRDFPLAVKWLDRAYDFLNSQELEHLSREAIKLRLAISQMLVQALIGLGTSEGFQRAENHVGYIESEIGDKLVVLLLRLEILIKAPKEVFDGGSYADVLRRMIRSVDISDSTFKLVVSHIRNLDDKNPTQAFQVLNEFLNIQVLPSQRQDWIERVAVLQAYLATNRRDTVDTAMGLKEALDSIGANTEKPLAASVALAIISLIWKRVDSNYAQGQLDMAETWCQLAVHPTLEQCGPHNIAKITRKLLLCHLQRNNIDGAKEILDSMSETTKNQPATMYLAYKLAIRSGDRDMASRCIESISSYSAKDPKFLYACCVDAQRCGDKLCALEALTHLANKHEFSPTGSIHLPALLRVLIRLQVSVLYDPQLKGEVDHNSQVNDLCQIFDGVVSLLQRDLRDERGAKLFSVDELNWFCRNAYNLGLKHTDCWELRQVISIFRACISIISHYPKDLSAQEAGDLSLRGIFCNFMIATALIALARSEDNVEAQLQHYLSARSHIKAFDEELETRLGSLDEESLHDLRCKMSALLVFDFEAAVSLKNWDDMATIARKAKECGDLVTLQAMADCTLRAKGPPVQVLYSTLQTIINLIWRLEKFDINKLAKYMRCLLQATLSQEVEIPLRVIEETCQHVSRAANTKKPFPAIELEWLATTAFNHACDLYKSQEDNLAKRWIDHSFSLAHLHRDGGVLEKTLHEHYTRLKWD